MVHNYCYFFRSYHTFTYCMRFTGHALCKCDLSSSREQHFIAEYSLCGGILGPSEIVVIGLCQWLDPGPSANPPDPADSGEVAATDRWRGHQRWNIPVVTHLCWHSCWYPRVHQWDARWCGVSIPCIVYCFTFISSLSSVADKVKFRIPFICKWSRWTFTELKRLGLLDYANCMYL